MDDSQTLYIGMSPGKPVYYEIKRHPYVCGVVVRLTHGRLSESVRIRAHLTEIDPEQQPEIYERYWELNPGTAELYRKDLERFRIFMLDRGTGRTFHMSCNDVVDNTRFTFGGEEQSPWAWAYEIDEEQCVGCGTCASLCTQDVISPTGNGKYRIDHYHCLECGRCADVCPQKAVRRLV